MFKELDIIVLNLDLPENGLKTDDVGTIVAVYENDKAYEVEFMTYEGITIAVVTLFPNQIRPIRRDEMMTVRALDQLKAA